MRPRFSILGLVELIALIAITLAIDRNLWELESARRRPPIVLDMTAWTIIGWGTLCGTYAAWRLAGVQRALGFILWSIAFGSAATFVNSVALFVVLFGVPSPRFWTFYLAIFTLVPTGYASIATATLASCIAIAAALATWIIKPDAPKPTLNER